MSNEYRHLPRECQTGTCDHDPGQCILYRSRRCLSGECTHAAENLVCGVSGIAAAVAQLPPPVRRVAAAVVEESAAHLDMPDVPCHGADCDGECSAPTRACPTCPAWAKGEA